MLIERPEPRAEGVRALRQFMDLPPDDEEARVERRLLRRMDLAEAVKRP